MATDSFDGKTFFSYETVDDVGASRLSGEAVKEPVLGYLNTASHQFRTAQCSVDLAVGHEVPHPLYPEQTVIQGTTLQSMNFAYKPLFGFVFMSSHYYLHEPTGQRRLKELFCFRNPRSGLMSRIWLGETYARVLLNCFVDLTTAIEIVSYFCHNQGSRWPGIAWQTDEEMDWAGYVYPEDELPNKADPPIRPAWRVSLTDFETFRQQGKDWNDYF